MQQLITLSDLVMSKSSEPRIRDITLAERLGFERRRVVRELIARNATELKTYGSIAVRHGAYRGQPTTEYHLNEGQALVICALSRTDRAAAVRSALIRAYQEWRAAKASPPAIVTRNGLAEEIEELSRVIRSPVWAVWRRMCHALHVTDPAAMTDEQIAACRAWLHVAGDYRMVPSIYWLRRYTVDGFPCVEMHGDMEKIATQLGKTVSSVYRDMELRIRESFCYPVTPNEMLRSLAWGANHFRQSRVTARRA